MTEHLSSPLRSAALQAAAICLAAAALGLVVGGVRGTLHLSPAAAPSAVASLPVHVPASVPAPEPGPTVLTVPNAAPAVPSPKTALKAPAAAPPAKPGTPATPQAKPGAAAAALPPKACPVDSIGLKEARRLLAAGAVAVDARRPEDFALGHLPGAVSLPAEEFDAYFPAAQAKLAPGATLLVYCGGGECSLSNQLAKTLRQMGYQSVRVMLGGFDEWRGAGLEVDK